MISWKTRRVRDPFMPSRNPDRPLPRDVGHGLPFTLKPVMYMNARLSHPRIPAILFLSVFGVYLLTICPTIYLGDSGELTAASFCLGIPHNSGYPLYALLGKIFCLLPLGTVGFRMNLMSACFGSLTVLLAYSVIKRFTHSEIPSIVGSLLLAFTPLLWRQTTAAEVYTLHGFFVVLLMRLLLWWDEDRDRTRLLVFVFVCGVSFGNHLQTVMLAPGVLFLVLSGDPGALLRPRRFILISLVFAAALAVYLYLPIRTDAGAALHTGDPDTLGNFWAHVTGSAHREGYVLNKAPMEYLGRLWEILRIFASQLGLFLILALLGWLKLMSIRWRIFFLAVIAFDLIYAVFLNTISIQITDFCLPSAIVLSILTGIGSGYILKGIETFRPAGPGTRRVVSLLWCSFPIILLVFNFGLCNQGRNYTAYEYALNIFRTLRPGNILFLDGDNNIFPIMYGRMAERMGEDVVLYDRQNVVYRMPYLGDSMERFCGKWVDLRAVLEKEIIEKREGCGVLYAAFDPRSIPLPRTRGLTPYGILHRVAREEEPTERTGTPNPWALYSSESIGDGFERDYLNRQLSAHYLFRYGRHLFLDGKRSRGIEIIREASRRAYDDRGIHSIIGLFFTDYGLFKEARPELEKALIHHEDPGSVHNAWGYYHYRRGDYREAVESFKRAIALRPENHFYHNNLGLALLRAGMEGEALKTFQRSLSLFSAQPEIERLMQGMIREGSGGIGVEGTPAGEPHGGMGQAGGETMGSIPEGGASR